MVSELISSGKNLSGGFINTNTKKVNNLTFDIKESSIILKDKPLNISLKLVSESINKLQNEADEELENIDEGIKKLNQQFKDFFQYQKMKDRSLLLKEDKEMTPLNHKRKPKDEKKENKKDDKNSLLDDLLKALAKKALGGLMGRNNNKGKKSKKAGGFFAGGKGKNKGKKGKGGLIAGTGNKKKKGFFDKNKKKPLKTPGTTTKKSPVVMGGYTPKSRTKEKKKTTLKGHLGTPLKPKISSTSTKTTQKTTPKKSIFSKNSSKTSIGKIGNKAENIVKSTGKVVGSIGKGILKTPGAIVGGAGKAIGTVGSAVSKALVPLMIGVAGYQAIKSWKKANETFGVEKATTGMKASASAGSILSFMTFGIVDEKEATKRIYAVAGTISKYTKDIFVNSGKQLLNDVKSVYSTASSWVSKTSQEALNKVKEFGTESWSFIKSSAQSVTDFFKNDFGNFLNSANSFVSSVFSGTLNTIKSGITSIWDGVSNVTSSIISNIPTFFSKTLPSALSTIKEKLSEYYSFIENILANIGKTLLTNFSNIASQSVIALKKLFLVTIPNLILEGLSLLKIKYDKGVEFLKDIFLNKIPNMVTELWDKISSLTLEDVKNFTLNAKNEIVGMFKSVSDYLQSIFDTIVNKVTKIKDWVSNLFTSSEKSVNTVEELEKKKIIETNFLGESLIKDWDKIQQLNTKQIQDLINYNDWKDEDLKKLKDILVEKQGIKPQPLVNQTPELVEKSETITQQEVKKIAETSYTTKENERLKKEKEKKEKKIKELEIEAKKKKNLEEKEKLQKEIEAYKKSNEAFEKTIDKLDKRLEELQKTIGKNNQTDILNSNSNNSVISDTSNINNSNKYNSSYQSSNISPTNTNMINSNSNVHSARFNPKELSVTYDDGTKKIGGHRNWRNNNPGNLEYGKFVKSHGAIGTDGRFAIFPSMTAGYNAQKALLQSGRYRNLTLGQALLRYAPPNENNTEAYLRSVEKNAGVSRNTKMSQFSDIQMNNIVRAMSKVEGMKSGKVIKVKNVSNFSKKQNLSTNNLNQQSSMISNQVQQNSQQKVSPISGIGGNISDNDASFLTALGKVESNNNYFLKPNSSGYEGKYQFRFRKGDDGLKYLKKMGITVDQWRKSPELQEKHMRLILSDYDKQLRAYGLPVNNWTRWLRHNQGLGGAKAILTNNLGYGGAKLRRTIRRNILNQFGEKEKARLGLNHASDQTLINAYVKKFKWRFTGNKGGAKEYQQMVANAKNQSPAQTSAISQNTEVSKLENQNTNGTNESTGVGGADPYAGIKALWARQLGGIHTSSSALNGDYPIPYNANPIAGLQSKQSYFSNLNKNILGHSGSGFGFNGNGFSFGGKGFNISVSGLGGLFQGLLGKLGGGLSSFGGGFGGLGGIFQNILGGLGSRLGSGFGGSGSSCASKVNTLNSTLNKFGRQTQNSPLNVLNTNNPNTLKPINKCAGGSCSSSYSGQTGLKSEVKDTADTRLITKQKENEKKAYHHIEKAFKPAIDNLGATLASASNVNQTNSGAIIDKSIKAPLVVDELGLILINSGAVV